MNIFLKTKALILLAGIFTGCLLLNCGKENHEEPGELVFHSLSIEKDTIFPGETVIVRATASGSSLNYFWSATLGDILGSGAEVTYAASPCSAGKNTITCKIESGSQSETKTVDIIVYE